VDEACQAHHFGVKTLPRHFRLGGSVDSGTFCFEYESCQTESSQQSAPLNAPRRNDVSTMDNAEPKPSDLQLGHRALADTVAQRALADTLAANASHDLVTNLLTQERVLLTSISPSPGAISAPTPPAVATPKQKPIMRDNYTYLGSHTLKVH
jgi:hypothetical protein